MDGEFVCEATTGLTKEAVGGGNLLIMGRERAGDPGGGRSRRARRSTRSPTRSCRFPGGIVRSGSKVGSKYKGVIASTNDAYCPTLQGAVKTALDADIASVLEIVIDGLTPQAVAACDARRDRGDREARPEARRGAHRRRQLRRQARAASSIISRTCCREAARPHAAPTPRAAARSVAAAAASSRRQDARTRSRGSSLQTHAHARRPSAMFSGCAWATRSTSASKAPATGSTGSAPA